MDPKATVREISELMALSGQRELTDDEIDRLCELRDALKEWCAKGGYVPS
jgi:hypothetical protein